MSKIILVMASILLFSFFAYGGECEIRVEKAIIPNFPLAAMGTKLSGDVKVKVDVNESGEVLLTRVVEGPKYIHEFIERYAKHWEFSKLGDASEKQCEVRQTEIIFSFTLLPKDTKPTPLTRSNYVYPNRVNIIEIEPNIRTN